MAFVLLERAEIVNDYGPNNKRYKLQKTPNVVNTENIVQMRESPRSDFDDGPRTRITFTHGYIDVTGALSDTLDTIESKVIRTHSWLQ